jgi:dephospho-CoA kinase
MGRQRWVLSGGLASGKSQVRKLLDVAGILTIDADRVGHWVIEPGGPAFADVASRWPHVVREGSIDRSALAGVVFHDPAELAALEAITHPHIFDIISTRVEEVDGPVVVEIPIPRHSLGSEWGWIVVDCRDAVRLERAIDRGMSPEDARARMARQPSREEWLAVADLVVPNHGSVDALGETVSVLLRRL